MTLAHSAFPADSLDSIQGPMAGQSPYQLSWRSTEWLTKVKWPLGGGQEGSMGQLLQNLEGIIYHSDANTSKAVGSWTNGELFDYQPGIRD